MVAVAKSITASEAGVWLPGTPASYRGHNAMVIVPSSEAWAERPDDNSVFVRVVYDDGAHAEFWVDAKDLKRDESL